MIERFIAIVDPSRIGDLTALAEARGWLPVGPWAWRFHAGWTRGWLTPKGATVHVVDQTVFETYVLAVSDDYEGLSKELVRLLRPKNLQALGSQWDAARTDEQKVRALLDLAGAQALSGDKVLPEFEAAIRKALDDAHPVVRLSAIRALAIAPSDLGNKLLAGRNDPDNPGLVDWRELFAQSTQAPEG